MSKNELSMEDLRQAVAKYNRPLRERVLEALSSGKGLTRLAISEKTFAAPTSVSETLQKLEKSGEVKRVQVGKCTFYYREGVADGQALASAVVGCGRPAGRSRRGRSRKGKR
jgi:predicted ArsR family transcriptional regulator